MTYNVEARATGEDGKQRSRSATFTTAEPSKDQTFVGEYHPDKGTTVGVAMPVSIVFNKPIHDKAAVERRLEVTSSPVFAGAWSWLKDRDGRDRIDLRPKAFWKPGTDVIAGVTAPLEAVVIERTGYMPMLERPDALNAELGHFLDRPGGG